MNELREKLQDAIVENRLPVDFFEGEDLNGEHYMVFDTTDDVEKFGNFVKALADDIDINVEYELETNIVYSDEYTTCDDCGKIIRTSPTHYGWQPDFYCGDGFIVCFNCFRESTDYQEEYLQKRINNPDNACQILTEDQLIDLGFVRLNGSYANGMHEGQNDNPKEIFDHYSEDYDEIVFCIDDVGQFDIHFSVWGRN